MKNKIKVGDQVFDYKYGFGTIEQILSEDRIEIRFGNIWFYTSSEDVFLKKQSAQNKKDEINFSKKMK